MHLFIHEGSLNAVSGDIVWLNETEHFEEKFPSVRNDALRYLFQVICVFPAKDTIHISKRSAKT